MRTSAPPGRAAHYSDRFPLPLLMQHFFAAAASVFCICVTCRGIRSTSLAIDNGLTRMNYIQS